MPRRQVRIALVIEGGVSLAVWMSGVVHEVDALCRAGSPERAPAGQNPRVLRWRELCDAMNLDVVVDVIAGTSAGGLNGALLACSLASGAPLPDLRALWGESGQLQRGALLRPDGDDALASLLDGGFFHDQLLNAFSTALERGATVGSPAPDAGQPERRPVTLITTATALGQQQSIWMDAFGHGFVADDHRRVYRFRQDPGQLRYTPPETAGSSVPDDVLTWFTGADPDDFDPAQAARITRAARASASFPLAFEPVLEKDSDVDLTDHRIGSTVLPAAELIDGGVLDNAPFAPLIEEISRREVASDWTRVIGYVVANNGVTATGTDAAGPGPALPWIPVAASALKLPSETSFRTGVETVSRLARTAGSLDGGPGALFELVLGGGGPAPDAVQSVFGLYRHFRLAEELLRAEAASDASMAAGKVSSPALPVGAPELAPLWVPGETFAAPSADGAWTWGAVVAERCLQQLIRALRSRYADDDPARSADIDEALSSVSGLLSAATAVRCRIEAVAAEPRPATVPMTGVVTGAYEESLAPAVLGRLVQLAVTRFATVDARGVTPEEVMRALLTAEVVSHCVSSPASPSEPPRIMTARIGPDVPCPVLGDVSPSARGDNKLFGSRLHHFGAFGRREWRDADFVWGRLDATAHLTRLIAAVARQPMAAADADEWWTVPLQLDVLAEEGTTPGAFAAAVARMDGMDDGATLAAIRTDPAGARSLEDAAADFLRMLKPANDDPPAVAVASRMVYTSFATRPTPGPKGLLPWLARASAGTLRLRRRLWTWVRTGQ